ncbi:MAG TPA: hypothetical protein VN843_01375, partial [Anaerolineales bacterium]|nr:hypothetical protein [Anaerolineales bacterium]
SCGRVWKPGIGGGTSTRGEPMVVDSTNSRLGFDSWPFVYFGAQVVYSARPTNERIVRAVTMG